MVHLLTQLPPLKSMVFCKQDKNDFHGKESIVVSFLFFFFSFCYLLSMLSVWQAVLSFLGTPEAATVLSILRRNSQFSFPPEVALLARFVSVPNTPAHPASGDHGGQDAACVTPPTESFSAQHFQGSLLFHPPAGGDIPLGLDAHRCGLLLLPSIVFSARPTSH